ncbi:MYB-like transcription factor ETC3 isoform X1 [Arachis duranensis]|uniref:MYB-like transcription factor ETC3 isoform X1 n=1 Tax=Arachis duranensis TaxID=130453 RepID=A0A6P5MPF3_ARADU|nr:MYB-like transcription factor ETC3 isoform X1 [Arachis duranensis]XP_052112386.1 MYB-like transcription factor ETC3 isoform X1 [Arachis duranensis]
MDDIDHSSSSSSSQHVSANSTEQVSNRASKVEFSEDEKTLISRMYKLVGDSRWSLIAGRIPGRTADEIEKYWTSRYSSRNE